MTDTLKTEALAWLSLLVSGRANDTDAAALKQWCAADPAHAEAFTEATLVWQILHPATIAARNAVPAQSITTLRISRRNWLGGGGLAFAASLGGVLVTRPPWHLWPSIADFGADYRTATGERKNVTLATNIQIELNTQSSLAVGRANQAANHATLISGEALVTIGNTGQTCVIKAGDCQISATEAKINIRKSANQVLVTCLSGAAAIDYRGRTARLSDNQQADYDGRGIGPIKAIDAGLVTGWQNGLLVFKNVAVDRVIDEVNRYRPGRIILLNQRIGKRAIDASFHLNNLEAVITYVKETSGAKATEFAGNIVVLS